jgi:hypothetical protein
MAQMDGDEMLANCAGSVQKLNLLLFLHEHPGLVATAEEVAKQLYIGNPCLAKDLIADLQDAGLVECVEDRCHLSTHPDVESCLDQLARDFDDPRTREKVLLQTNAATSRRRCLDQAHEPGGHRQSNSVL